MCAAHGNYSPQMMNEPDPEEEGGCFPYIVCLDSVNRLISVPYDDPKVCRPEVCFEDSFNGEPCLTAVAPRIVPPPRPSLRFNVGDRVACLTAGPGGKHQRRWSAGTISQTWYQAPVWPTQMVPYRVRLDGAGDINQSIKLPSSAGDRMLSVHRDVHTLVRALKLQQPGLYADGDGDRFSRSVLKDGRQQVVDQHTQKVRVSAPKSAKRTIEPDDATEAPPAKNSKTQINK